MKIHLFTEGNAMASKAYSKIVVAVDGSSTSDLALQEAIRVASSGATILALYVVDNAMVLFDAGYYDPSQIERAFVESGTRALEAASKLLGDAGVKFETKLVTEPAVAGDIAGSINAAASEWGGDLLVIGTRPTRRAQARARQRCRSRDSSVDHAGLAGAGTSSEQ
jgi:nucleotide-binding universal stress UspA family protein